MIIVVVRQYNHLLTKHVDVLFPLFERKALNTELAPDEVGQEM